MAGGDGLSRREFAKTVAGAAAAGGLAMFAPQRIFAAPGRKVFKVGLIGCGGRGNGALDQHVNAARILNDALGLGIEIQVAGTADWYKEKAERTGAKYGAKADACFGGADAYKKLLATDIDIVLMATPPTFRPLHFEKAIEAGKHVFMEKPVAVDPVGCRRVIAAGEAAKKKELMVIAGTQRRHQKGYIDTQAAVAEGALGRILGGSVSWCGGHLGARTPFETVDASALAGGWVNWVEMSGDHIVEQHVHNIDIMNWFLGTHPERALGFGYRARRPAGNQYDFFSIDFQFPGGVRIHSMCRQINGCGGGVGEHLVCEKGVTRCGGGLTPTASPVPAEIPQQGSGHLQEHINMLYYLVKGKIINEAHNVATSTATAVMGRIAAYTGREVLWRDMMEDPRANPEIYNLQLKPAAEEFETGITAFPKDGVVAIPGVAVGEKQPPRPGRAKKA